MIWIWLSTAVILIGAELDAEMEHQTARHEYVLFEGKRSL